ncbi:unnamed protein product [Echinostoma caproni]|uniref:Ubiquitin-like domain-containing protein n=1 Tax=Echinostoma caproni TaxID=27848 RepID=A0A183AET4_9TREM|nr:unnamed protein product [Echinostoma caproni]
MGPKRDQQSYSNRFRRQIARRRKYLITEREKYLLNEHETRQLLKRFAIWYRTNYSAFETVLDSFSSNIEGDALVDVFNDMDAPWNSIETYVLLAYLDREEYGFVTSEMLSRLAEVVRPETTEAPSDSDTLYEGLPDPVDRETIPVYVRFASSLAPECPLNLDLSMNVNSTIKDLAYKIGHSVDLPTNEIVLKSDQYSEAILDESIPLGSLMQDGYVDLFYDYKLGLTDCPVVNYDAYFTWRTVDRILDL